MNRSYFLPSFLLIITFLVRCLTVVLIGKIPCMDQEYLVEASRLLDDPGRHPIGLAPSYGILLYGLNAFTSNLFVASSICYVISSFLVSLFAYLIARTIFNEKTGLIVLGLMIFIPNLTVAIAGYSHTPVVGLAFLMCAAYILLLHNRSVLPLLYAVIGFGSIATLSIYFRPENIIVVVALLIVSVFNTGLRPLRRLIFISGSVLMLFITLSGHAWFIKNNSSSSHVGTFSDAKYSYRAFIHTLSLRDIGVINDERALELSIPLYGTPESNEWKISTAIRKNPSSVVSNILFNLKDLLHAFGHPLYSPFYLYFFIGAAVFAQQSPNSLWYKIALLIAFLASLLSCIFFHVEIRYLSTSLMPVMMMSAWGLAQINNSRLLKWTLVSVTVPTAIIFLLYLRNNMNLSSLCG